MMESPEAPLARAASTKSRLRTWVVAVSEEFFFRGLLQKWLTAWTARPNLALIATSLLFGAAHLLWASDYPHPDTVWPNSRAAIERQMRDLSPEMRRKLTHDNAAKLYGLS